jgi:purine-cytosine permease-like protein
MYQPEEELQRSANHSCMRTSASFRSRPVKPTVRLRVTGIAVISVIVFIVALAIPGRYLGSFNDFVNLMLYFLVPWTAVNPVDFYFVRHGYYSIMSLDLRPELEAAQRSRNVLVTETVQ